MNITASFICPQCQRVLRTAEPLAPGKRVRCPSCLTIFAPPAHDPRPASPIRATDETANYPWQRDHADLERPARQTANAVYDDGAWRGLRRDADDDAGYDGRPRRRQRTQRSALPFIIGGSIALALILAFVVTAFLWPGFLRSKDSPELARELPATTQALLAH